MKYLIFFCLLIGSLSVHSQDLNARVQILAPQIANSNQRILDILEASIKDFLNNKRWSSDALQPLERIDCNFVIYILHIICFRNSVVVLKIDHFLQMPIQILLF
jgi:hypothetical protein